MPDLPLDLPRTRRLLEAGIRQHEHFGAQVYASIGASTSPNPPAVEVIVGHRSTGSDDTGRQSMTADTLMIWLSSTKPVTAVALALLWQRGELDLDDPVARYVPEFGEHGKDSITLRHVLTHTGGIRMLDIGWPEASWQEIIAKICSRRPEPRWPPGAKAGYHLASSWFILGEVVARISGQAFSSFVRNEVFEPLGMMDSWVGMPDDRFEAYGDRIGHMYGTESARRRSSNDSDNAGGRLIERSWHRRPHVVGCSPGGNGYGPIRQLGTFYEMLLRRGISASGQRLLTPQTIEAMTTPQRVGLMDLTFKHQLDWGLGFIVDSKHYLSDDDGAKPVPYGYGPHASRRTFGHSGFQSSTAFADPEHDLVVALVVNGQPGEPRHTERFDALTAAIYEDLDLVAT